MAPERLVLQVETVGWNSCPVCEGVGILSIDGRELGCSPCGGKGGVRMVRLAPITPADKAVAGPGDRG